MLLEGSPPGEAELVVCPQLHAQVARELRVAHVRVQLVELRAEVASGRVSFRNDSGEGGDEDACVGGGVGVGGGGGGGGGGVGVSVGVGVGVGVKVTCGGVWRSGPAGVGREGGG